MTDPAKLPTLSWSHVLELRHAATVEASDEPCERDHTRIADLADHGLMTWDGGSGKGEDGQWVKIRPGGTVVTPAGHAALRIAELVAQQMTSKA